MNDNVEFIRLTVYGALLTSGIIYMYIWGQLVILKSGVLKACLRETKTVISNWAASVRQNG